MQIKIISRLFSIWPRHRKFLRQIKHDYRKVASLKFADSRLLPDEEDQLFIKVEREF